MIMTFPLRTFLSNIGQFLGSLRISCNDFFLIKQLNLLVAFCNHFVVAIRLFCISVTSEAFAIVICMTKAVGPLPHNLCVMSILQSDQEPISRSLQLPYKP